jgi:hypothetical protein
VNNGAFTVAFFLIGSFMNKLAVLGSKIKKPRNFVSFASFLIFGRVSLGFLNRVSYERHRTVPRTLVPFEGIC